jgi:hypothetical protein
VDNPAPSVAKKIFSWTVLASIVTALVVAFGAYIGSLIDMPWWKAGIGGVLLLAALVGYVFGLEATYQHFSKPLGFHCELRPVALPRSARDDVDLVITGNYLGRPFTLYREIATSKTVFHGNTTHRTRFGVVEWTGDDIRLPAFMLDIDPATASSNGAPAAEPPGNRAPEKTAKYLRAALKVSGVEFGHESNLGRRATLSAADQAAVRGVFTRSVCDRLDPLIAQGSVEAVPGLLVIRQESTSARSGFPLPWRIEEYLKEGEQMRRVFMP